MSCSPGTLQEDYPIGGTQEMARAASHRTKRWSGGLLSLLLSFGLENTEEPAGAPELTLAGSFRKCTL